MRFHNPGADIFVPDGLEPMEALGRTTHLCICAHQDDIEIMAYHGIAECFGQKDQWFTGVVLTNADERDEECRPCRNDHQPGIGLVNDGEAA